eukprot:snap_masked-scaffold_32-processed-gene-2.15-mRNA-1 protein AED:1.00 eAED:1.00 QI:0/0/0/0/1/1/2/0/61
MAQMIKTFKLTGFETIFGHNRIASVERKPVANKQQHDFRLSFLILRYREICCFMRRQDTDF